MKWFLAFIVLGVLPAASLAQETEHASPALQPATSSVSPDAHAEEQEPEISTDATWAGQVVGVIGALFALALLIGIIVRLNTPAEIPAAHHDDSSGAGHDEHGLSGHGASAAGHH